MKSLGFALVIAMLTPIFMFAEGSKDFRDYPGKRLWLDTRDSQQIKVYAAVGEFINVGASHTGISGGFITVFRPDGTVAAVYNNSGVNAGLGIINNDTEEIEGPTGGGSTNGLGYNPGIIEVPAGMDGAWTVVMDFPTYAISSFDTLLNDQPWTRAANQKLGNRVILAWDVTVTQGGAGNDGGTPVEGRVYSNEYISILNKNGNQTSPTFYVLSRDGFQYQVDFMDADPFRFPISSNSLGLVEAGADEDFTPIYQSRQEADFTRSDDPDSWINGQLYLYEPQAEDAGPLINHKIFFNLPDENMPDMAFTTDIFRNNQHQTWLYNDIQILTLDSLFFFGANPDGNPCEPPFYEFGKGGFFVTQTNIGGQVTIQIDIDNNGNFDDMIDITLTGNSDGGLDSIYWDGLNGNGEPFAGIGDTFNLSYSGYIRFGEIHIANTDVEDNFGGVTFELLNAPPSLPADIFYYDHSDLTAVAGAVSGMGGTPGNAQPTSTPFTYGNAGAIIPDSDFGNNRYLDQWTFNDFTLPMTTTELFVVEECDCNAIQTPMVTVLSSTMMEACVGDMATLQATNEQAGLGDLNYTWQGPNGFFFTETISDTDTSTVNITIIDASNGGDYIVTATSADGCISDPDTINLVVNPLPELMLDVVAYEACEGDDLMISATNITVGIGPVNYIWTGPNFTFTGMGTGVGPFIAIVPAIGQDMEGTYTLSVTDDNGCGAVISVEVAVNENPTITNLMGGGGYCEGQDILLSGENAAMGMTEITYTWSGPNGFFVQQTTTDIDGPFEAPITGATILDSGDYMLCLESDQGCGPTCETVTVTVNAGLEIVNVIGDGNQCLGQTFTLSAENSITGGINEITYTWTLPDATTFVGTAGPSGPFDLVVDNPTADAAGTYTLVLEADNGCTSDPVSVEVVMNENPVLSEIVGGGAYCLGDMVTLTSNNTVAGVNNYDYVWTGPNGMTTGTGTGMDDIVLTIDMLSAADTGTYTLNLTSGAGCVSNTVSTQISLNDLPVVVDVTPDTIVCENDELILSATNATMDEITYTWTGPNGYNATGTAAAGATFTESVDPIGAFGAGEYVLVVASGSCSADPITVNVETRPNPDLIPIVGGGTFCVGDSVTLFTVNTQPGIDSVFYTCVLPDGSIVVELHPATDTIFITFPSITLDDAGILSCAAESTDSCGSSLVTTMINVQSTPIISDLTPDTTVCANENLTLTAVNNEMGTGDVIYTWTGPNGATFTGTAPFNGPFPWDITNIQVADAGEYCLNVVSDGGCMAMEECMMVMVNPTPMLTPTDGGGEYCEGDDVTLTTMNTVVGTGDLMYTCTGPNGFMQTGTIGENETIELILENIMANQAGTYTCVVETAEGCVSNESSATITVNATPAIADIDGGGPYCEGDNIMLTATNDVADVGMITYTWTGPNGFTFTGTAPGNGPFPANVPNAQLTDAGEYCLNITSMAGCGSDEMCVDVVVNPNPMVTDFTGGGEFCPDDVTTLAGTIDLNGTTSVDWTMTGPGLNESGTSTANETISFDVTVSEATAGTYTFTLTSEDGCTASATQTITLIQIPTPVLVPILDPICPGDELQLVVDPALPAGTVYEWFENGTSLGTSTDPMFMVMNAQGGTYSVTAMLDGCSESSADISVLVVPAPVAVDDNYQIDFNTQLNDDVTTNDQTSPPTGVTATLDSEPEFGTVEFNEDGTFTYTPDAGFAGLDMFTYTICSIDCPDECSSATVTISVVDPECDEIYNLISPNGDGDNDVFFVPCLDDNGVTPPLFPTNTIKIFNRWGDVVYDAKPYDNTWGGTNNDGQDLPAGTYFYMIELREGGGDGDDNLLVGYVTVVR